MPDKHGMLTAMEVAAILGIKHDGVRRAAMKERLPCVRVGNRRRYRMEDVMRYDESRPRAKHRTIPPDIQAWGPRNRPIEHHDLLTTDEAAAILGVVRNTVHYLVHRGVLPAYQRDPCKQGVRIMIPAFYVYALRDRPAYQKRREAYRKRDEIVLKYTSAWPERSIEPVPQAGVTITFHRDYGDLYTTRQAAWALGINPCAVRCLHYRGRLHGQTREPELDAYREALGGGRRGRGNRWIFFRKDEVHALLRDPAYKKKRVAEKLGRSQERILARRAAETGRAMREWEEARKRRRPLFAAWPRLL